MTQETDAGSVKLFDTGGETIAQIETDGSTLKPFLNAIRQVADECRIHFTEDGLHVTAVGPANVFMIDADLPASAFESYALPNGESAVGVSLSSFRYAVRRARMGSDDTLSLRVNTRRAYASIGREYDDGTEVVTEDSVKLIDPDSVRQEPDIPNVDLTTLDVSRDAFIETAEYADATFSEHIKYEVFDGDLVVQAKGDQATSKARITDAAPSDCEAHGLYSSDYLSDALTAINRAKADTFMAELGEQVPLRLVFGRTDDDGNQLLTGELLLAPRIKRDAPGGS